jgi:putative sigma-54 modulation protein
MDIKITFKNIDHTPSLDSRIEKKSLKLEKFLDGRSSIQWICFSNDIAHFAEITLEGPTFRINAKASDKNLYHALDKVINKVQIQLKKQKERWKNPIHQPKVDFKYNKGREEALDELAEEANLKKKKPRKKAA